MFDNNFIAFDAGCHKTARWHRVALSKIYAILTETRDVSQRVSASGLPCVVARNQMHAILR